MKKLKDFLQKECQVNDAAPSVDDSLSPEEIHRHLDIQKRGKVDLHDYAAHVLFHTHHPELLSALTEDFNDVQRRHAAGQQMDEYDSLLNKLKEKAALSASSTPVYEGKESKTKELDPPAVLIMRRKSVRQFPNGQRVALYYVDKINKYVTVPYEDMQWSTNEETVLERIKATKESGETTIVEHLDGSVSEVTPKIAQQIMDTYKKINETNKAKMADMLEASSKHFQAIAKFSKE